MYKHPATHSLHYTLLLSKTSAVAPEAPMKASMQDSRGWHSPLPIPHAEDAPGQGARKPGCEGQ